MILALPVKRHHITYGLLCRQFWFKVNRISVMGRFHFPCGNLLDLQVAAFGKQADIRIFANVLLMSIGYGLTIVGKNLDQVLAEPFCLHRR
jgi:hypothetical protein